MSGWEIRELLSDWEVRINYLVTPETLSSVLCVKHFVFYSFIYLWTFPQLPEMKSSSEAALGSLHSAQPKVHCHGERFRFSLLHQDPPHSRKPDQGNEVSDWPFLR